MKRYVVLLAAALAGPVVGQVTSRVSISTAGAEGNADGGRWPVSITADGRYVAFTSWASNLVAGDTTGYTDVFVRDRHSGTTERVSVTSSGGEVTGWSGDSVSISADGRFVAFQSDSHNLVGFTLGYEVYVHDRQTGTTDLVSIDPNGVSSNYDSRRASISANGRYVAFTSLANHLVAGDTNGEWDVFVRDLQSGTTERVNVATNGAQADGFGEGGDFPISISADGRYVAFTSGAWTLVPNDGNGKCDVFVRDRQSATTERVSINQAGGGGNYDSGTDGISVSADGRYVAFSSPANNLVTGDMNGGSDVFVRDRQSGTTELIYGVSSSPYLLGGGYPSISADGRYVAFLSGFHGLVPGDTNAKMDVFVRDRQSGTTERVSVDSSGAQADGDSGYFHSGFEGDPVYYSMSMSAHGRHVAFGSFATNLVPGDTNGAGDVFVHDRAFPVMTSQCSPGTGGAIACPCDNPPSGPGRGCDNSSATGGAILSASGIADLSQDTLVFTTSGEKPTALSILAQWVGPNMTGITFGQGVRCTSGTFKRLFAKNAVGGSITVPDFGAGEPTVSARSVAKGDTILAGQFRWYVAYYRDNTVLGGCPASSTFNATQTGQIYWSF